MSPHTLQSSGQLKGFSAGEHEPSPQVSVGGQSIGQVDDDSGARH
jgi:hypothetical protein